MTLWRARCQPRSPCRLTTQLHRDRQLVEVIQTMVDETVRRVEETNPPGCVVNASAGPEPVPGRDSRHVTFGDAVARGGVEPPTFRFSVGRSYQLSYLAGCTRGAKRVHTVPERAARSANRDATHGASPTTVNPWPRTSTSVIRSASW